MDKDALESLLDKYQRGECSPEEVQMVESWYASYDSRETQSLSKARQMEMYHSLTQKIQEETEQAGSRQLARRKKIMLRVVGIAASLLLVISTLYVFNAQHTKGNAPVSAIKIVPQHDLLPGSEKATLTLGDGTVVNLEEVKPGLVASQGNAKLIKLSNGRLTYKIDKITSGYIPVNEIRTPRGGAYQVVLPDGSHVWLNSTSSIRFPAEFSATERKIELTGEAYFEITHDAKRPFRVGLQSEAANGSTCSIEVLGTHFNVMAYADEQSVKTTLLEGSVRVSGEHINKILKPGQQAELKPDFSSAVVSSADIEEAIAWKNNLFWFNNADIHSVMRQVARWYNVDISYEGNVSKIFKGSVPRDLTAAKLFDILERTGGVHFKITDKKVIVTP